MNNDDAAAPRTVTPGGDSPGVNRRELFGTAGAIALGGLMLDAAISRAADPAAGVEDKASAIRIAALTATPVGGKCFVKIETNFQVTGWGEITGLEPRVAAELAQSLFELLRDENPTRIEYLWQKLFRSHRDMRGGPFMVHTLAAIDMALWDIAGKLWGVPVYRLLGGPCRDKVRMYPTAKALKPGTGGPHPFSGTPQDVEALVRAVKAAREQVGPDGTVMFDAHSAVPPPMLIQFANSIAPYDVLFIEEPAVPGNIEVFKRLKEAIRVPLACGERDRTIWGVIPYLQERCIDVLQPDVGHTGGISQMRKIATLAEAYSVPLAPHSTCSELGLTASLHVAASIPHLLIHEGYVDGHIMPPGVARKNWELTAEGYATLPQGPGLGVEMDEGKMAEVAADPNRQFKWPEPVAPDGSVIDY